MGTVLATSRSSARTGGGETRPPRSAEKASDIKIFLWLAVRAARLSCRWTQLRRAAVISHLPLRFPSLPERKVPAAHREARRGHVASIASAFDGRAAHPTGARRDRRCKNLSRKPPQIRTLACFRKPRADLQPVRVLNNPHDQETTKTWARFGSMEMILGTPSGRNAVFCSSLGFFTVLTLFSSPAPRVAEPAPAPLRWRRSSRLPNTRRRVK